MAIRRSFDGAAALSSANVACNSSAARTACAAEPKTANTSSPRTSTTEPPAVRPQDASHPHPLPGLLEAASGADLETVPAAYRRRLTRRLDG